MDLFGDASGLPLQQLWVLNPAEGYKKNLDHPVVFIGEWCYHLTLVQRELAYVIHACARFDLVAEASHWVVSKQSTVCGSNR